MINYRTKQRFTFLIVALALVTALLAGMLVRPAGASTDNVATVEMFLEETPAEWADYFSDDAVYYSGGTYSNYDKDESGTPIADWLSGLAADYRFENPYPVDYIFTRLDTDTNTNTGYRDATGHVYADSGYTHNYYTISDFELVDDEAQGEFEEGAEFADTVVVKTSAVSDSTDTLQYVCMFFHFNEDGEIMVLNIINDTSAEQSWLAEYEANTYAANVGGTVYTGLGSEADPDYQDVYNSIYKDYDSLLTANITTLAKWWNAAGEYRGWLRFGLATEDATKAVTQLFYNEDLFKYNGHDGEADLYYDTEYAVGTLGGNRVNTIISDGWLYGLMEDENGDPSIQFDRWGWYTDNRVYVCVNDPNLLLCDNLVSYNTYYDRMLVSITMRDGLVRDLRESSVFGVRDYAEKK